ncbi:MAG TPA: folylpolyglutamate synthase/dihydrofolate synthase family protein [Thermoanaerobaculia bacterium]|nr:folylpolyglutamate synthase/dihydrofolate synthase family protein [Thermoanaerobaculia bacterium]
MLDRLEKLGIRLGLENVRHLLAGLGDPQLRFPSVLVAGSNGKGSTSALLAAMASAAGYRTGLYTSPHLESVEERIRYQGLVIDPGHLAQLLQEVVRTAEKEQGTPPTYFEAVTAAAFLFFAERKVDLAILEVGMGGRLDATNVCDPVLSLITSISLEHREHLGDTLAAIAREKAGTFRPGRPALVWLEEPEPSEAVRTVAEELGTDLRFAPEIVSVREIIPRGMDGQRVKLVTPRGEHDLETRLPGTHQAKNLALAVLAAETLRETGFEISPKAIAEGARTCRWPGRLERISLPGGRLVLLDAAHNPEGTAALARFLEGFPEPFDLLFGALGDKDAAEMLGSLAPRVRKIFLTRPESDRAREPKELAALLPGRGDVEVPSNLERALAKGLPLNARLLVCGSIYLAGEVRKKLRERFGIPGPASEPLYPLPNPR